MNKPSISVGSLVLPAFLWLALSGCFGGSAVGDCVTNYTDGDVLRQSDFTEGECSSSCEERTGPGGTGENVIVSCFWDGSRRGITGV